jgi:hypothetical protein
MESTAQLPALLYALVFCVLLALYVEVVAVQRKGREDQRRYQERMKRNHGTRRD